MTRIIKDCRPVGRRSFSTSDRNISKEIGKMDKMFRNAIAMIWLWNMLRKHYRKGVVAIVGKSTGATAPFLCSEYSINLV